MRTRISKRYGTAIAIAVLAIAAAFAAVELAPILRAATGPFLAFNDLFAQWSFALFARTNDARALYDPAALHRFQIELEPALRQSFPFPYPPTYLFVVWPLGALPFSLAQLAWDAAGIALFVCALAAPRFEPGVVALAVLAPATTMALAYGQNGLLEGALLVGGLRLAPSRPLLGGVLLGLATVKPSLGLLVPIALLAARAWRAAAAAAATAALLALLAAWAFGPQAWQAWLDYGLQHAAWVQSEVSDYRKPTVLATMRLLGAGPAAAPIQAALALAVAAIVAWRCRRGLDPSAIATLLSGTFLALPFAFVYDLPPVTGAVLLLLDETAPISLLEAAILAAAVLFPAVTTLTTRFFWINPATLVLLFAVAAFKRKRPGARPGRIAENADEADQDE